MASNLSTFDVLLVTICMSAGINLLLMIVAALSSPGSSFSFIYWILLTGTTICGFFLYLYMTMTKKRLVIFTSAALYICGVHGYYLYYLLSRPCPRKVGCSPFNTMAFFFGVMLLAATFPVMAIMLVVSWLQVWEGQPISPRTSADLEKQPRSVLKRPTTPALDVRLMIEQTTFLHIDHPLGLSRLR